MLGGRSSQKHTGQVTRNRERGREGERERGGEGEREGDRKSVV